MWQKYRYILWVLVIQFNVFSQELYPLSEPASNVPKGVIGLRSFNQTYNEFGSQKYMTNFRVMYGLSSRLTLSGSITLSNHHTGYLPLDLITHTHQGTKTNYFTNNAKKGLTYPMNIAGFYFYGKYRFFNIDKKNEHFRMAAYGGFSTVDQAHDEAESSLMDDSKGFGGGIISTYLKNHFAASLTLGYNKPGKYEEQVKYENEPTITHTQIQYGQSLNYSLSFGYLLFPKIYKNYSQPNLNVYLEFIGKTYDKATIYQNETLLHPTNSTLIQGSYLEIHPGIQTILHSNLRIDFSIGFNLINKSYIHQYPMYTLSIQRYFYL